MKAIPLPEGMVVTKRIYIGEKKYKMKLYQGHIYSSLNKRLNVQIGRDIGHHYVVMNICLRESILCSHCESGHDVDVELVMN